MGIAQSIEDFVELGLSRLEAEIYVFLLQNSPATGYKIAKGINRPNSNTYKAVATLENKGAILVDEGENRLCQAVPVEELLEQMEHRFKARKQRAAENVKQLEVAPGDYGVFRLATVDQVYERCRRMLATCEGMAFVDLFPIPFARLRPDIEAAVARGVKVALKVYEPTELDGAQVVEHHYAEVVMQRWSGQWITMAVDGRQQLEAYLSAAGEEIHLAVWSSSPILSWAYHSCAYSDLLLSALIQALESGATKEEALDTYRQWIKQVPYPEPPPEHAGLLNPVMPDDAG